MREIKGGVSWFSSAEQKALLDSLPYGVAFIGPDDNLMWFNETMATDHSWQEESLGRNAVKCHKPQNRERVGKILEHFHRGGAKPVIMRYQTPRRSLQTMYAPVYNKSGDYLGATCTIVEILSL